MIRQRGFTLLEISIAMIITAALAVVAARSAYIKLDGNMTEHTAAEVWVIGEYAQKWVQDNGTWPNETNDCTGAIATMDPGGSYIPTRSPWGSGSSYDYATLCPLDPLNPLSPRNFSITAKLDDNWAPALTNMLAVTQMASGSTDTTVTTLPLPGSIAALSNVLKRTADPLHPEYNQMETDLDMNNNSIVGINALTAISIDVTTIDTEIIRDRFDPTFWIQPHSTSYLDDIEVGTARFGNSTGSYSYNGTTVVAEFLSDSNVPAGPGSDNGSIDVNDIYLRSVEEYLSARLPNWVEKASYIVKNGDLVAKPDCPWAGNSPQAPSEKIKFRPAINQVNTTPNFKYMATRLYAIDAVDPAYWQAIIQVKTGNPQIQRAVYHADTGACISNCSPGGYDASADPMSDYGVAIADVYCYYPPIP